MLEVVPAERHCRAEFKQGGQRSSINIVCQIVAEINERYSVE